MTQMVKNLPVIWETWVQSLVWKGLLEKDMATHSSRLAGKLHGQMSLVGYSPWGIKSWMCAVLNSSVVLHVIMQLQNHFADLFPMISNIRKIKH